MIVEIKLNGIIQINIKCIKPYEEEILKELKSSGWTVEIVDSISQTEKTPAIIVKQKPKE